MMVIRSRNDPHSVAGRDQNLVAIRYCLFRNYGSPKCNEHFQDDEKLVPRQDLNRVAKFLRRAHQFAHVRFTQ